jgi:hypothetical protein
MARQRADAKLTELTESLLDLSGYAALSEELRAVLPKRSEGNEVSASVAGDPVEELCDVLSIIFDLADDRLSKLTTHDTPSRYSAHITDSPASVNLSIAGDCSPFRGGDEAKGMEAKIFLRDDLATLRERVRRDAELVAEKERQLRAAEEEANEWREEIWRREEAWGNERAALAKNSQDAADEIEYDPPPANWLFCLVSVETQFPIVLLFKAFTCGGLVANRGANRSDFRGKKLPRLARSVP